MNRYRAILAASLGLLLGIAIGGGGCANGGSGDTSGGDDDSGTTADVTLHEGGGDADATSACPSGKTSCSGVCSDTLTDGKNCGSCGHTCGMSQVCNAGTCGYSCASPETLCNAPPEGGSAAEGGGTEEAGGGSGDDAGEADGGSPAADAGTSGTDAGGSSDGGGAPYCANLTNDNNNCGACGNVCGPNHTCSTVAGSTACGLSCPAGMDPCIASDSCIPSGTCCASCPVPGQVCPMPGAMCQCPGGETLCMATPPGQCISSNDCCTQADCAGVAGSTCPTPGQACQCPNGDKACLSGKTCVAQTACCTAAGACCQDPLGKSCSAATAQAALTVGGTPLSVSGISTATGEEDWIQVTFSGQTNLAFHGHVLFTTNPNNEFVFDIASDCMGTLLSCGTESTTCSGKTEWEETYAALTPVQEPTGTTWKPVPVTVVNIRVYRANATAAPTCDQWTLAISE